MPELGLGKQRFHPDLPLAHGFLVRLGSVVAAHALEALLGEAGADASAPWGRRAPGAERTDRAGRRWRLIDPAAGRLAMGEEAQGLPAGIVVRIGGLVVD